MGGDDYVIDGDLAFSNKSDALKFYQEQYHKKKEWQGLTKEELAEISEFHFHGALSGREFYDDIEAKLKEKNT